MFRVASAVSCEIAPALVLDVTAQMAGADISYAAKLRPVPGRVHKGAASYKPMPAEAEGFRERAAAYVERDGQPGGGHPQVQVNKNYAGNCYCFLTK